MKKLWVVSALLYISQALQATQAPNIHAPIQGHTLYGDLRITQGRGDKKEPMSFLLTLYTAAGNIMGREHVPVNGRFRFPNVPNGEYEIVVERDTVEVGRVRLLLQETRFTDIRKDITLELSEDASTRSAPKVGLISAADVYARGPEGSAQFDKALKAGAGKDFDGAISILHQIVSADPGDFEAWAELGTMQFMKGDKGEAGKSYARALAEKPSYFPALLNLGKLQIALRQFDVAIETLMKAVEAQPRSADANYFLGEACLQNRKGSKAVGYFNEALRLDPVGKADAHLRLAALYNAANMKDRASLEYEQFLTKKPDYPERKKLEQYIRDNRKP